MNAYAPRNANFSTSAAEVAPSMNDVSQSTAIHPTASVAVITNTGNNVSTRTMKLVSPRRAASPLVVDRP